MATRDKLQPLRITGRMSGLMIEPEHPIAFDGVLAWAAVESARLEGAQDPLEAQDRLPLERDPDTGVWKASWVFRRYDSALQKRQQVKRLNPGDLLDGRNQGFWEGRIDAISLGTGSYKGAVLERTYRQVGEVVAWCVGQRRRIEELLAMVEGLGALRRQGFGRVTGWTIEPDPEAAQNWQRRALPHDPGGYLCSTGTLAPPYWRRDAVRQVWMPLSDQL